MELKNLYFNSKIFVGSGDHYLKRIFRLGEVLATKMSSIGDFIDNDLNWFCRSANRPMKS